MTSTEADIPEAGDARTGAGSTGDARTGAGSVPAGDVRAPWGTARLTLSPLTAENAGALAGCLSDPALWEVIGNTPEGPEELRSRYLRMARGSTDPAVVWANWVVRARPVPGAGGDGSPAVGTVQATLGPGSVAEVAWMVARPWQGAGYAREAAGSLVRWLESHGIRRIIAHVHPAHHASAAVARAAGLAPTAHRQDGEVRWERVCGNRGPERNEAPDSTGDPPPA